MILQIFQARLARRQLAKVTNEGLIEYALQVIMMTMMMMMMVIMTVTYDRSFLFQRYCDDGVDSE